MAKKKSAQLADAIEHARPDPVGNTWIGGLSQDAREFMDDIIRRRREGRLNQYSTRKLHDACKQAFASEFPKDKMCAKSTFALLLCGGSDG